MLGYSLFSNLSEYRELEVYGTVRSVKGKEHFFIDYADKITTNVDVEEINILDATVASIKPDVVINCIGLIKQHDISKQHIDAISINSLLPHQLASVCNRYGAKLIHFSTDCVFSGAKGGYLENHTPDAHDLYGKSKYLGEVNYEPHLTLRTSIIGHELSSCVSLIDWFLSQKNKTKGFSKAIFSGLPTCVVAKLLAEYILPKPELTGLLHLSVAPIDKYSLLNLVSTVYRKEIEVVESTELIIDRSLNSDKLRQLISLKIPTWEALVSDMYSDYQKRYQGKL